MWIARNNDQIIMAKETREELEQALKFMRHTSIEETSEKYVLYNGQYITQSEYLVIAKAEKLAELKAKRDEAEVAPITTDKGSFDFDAKSREAINLKISRLDNYTNENWTLADNSVANVRKCDLNKVVDYADVRNSKIHVIYSQLKEAINNATTVEELEAIAIDFPTELTDENKSDLAEKHRLSLTCPKRKFVLMLEELGVPYESIKAFIAKAGSQAKMEWELCTELWRNNSLLDPMAQLMGVTPTIIDLLFRYENGEVTDEEYQDFLQGLNK